MHHTGKAPTIRSREMHHIEGPGQRLLSALEKRAGYHFNALLKQLNCVSGHEVRGLLRRVAQLERLTRSSPPAEHEPFARSGPRTHTTSLRRYAETLWDEV